MRTFFIAAASALFFAYFITEVSMRLWPGAYFPLLLLAFVALFVSGVLNLKLAGAFSGAGAAAPRAGSGRSDKPSRPPRETRRSRPDGASKPRNGGATDPEKARPEAPAPSGPRETGTVKWFNRTKGFGFVIRESGEEIFVHQRSIRAVGEGDQRQRPGLKDGQSVTFVVAEREKGLQAEDVVPDESS